MINKEGRMSSQPEIRTSIIRKEYPLEICSPSDKKRTTFKFLAKVESKAFFLRKSAESLLKNLSDYDKKRFTLTFNSITNQIDFQTRYIRQLFNPDKNSSSLLDIGSGPGILAKKLLLFYHQITALDCDPSCRPFLQSLKRRQGFDYILDRFEDATIKKKFSNIICIHTIYYMPQKKWGDCIKKMLELLKPGGKALIIMVSPKGKMHDLREPISSTYTHCGGLRAILEKSNISYSKDVFEFSFPEPNRKKFKDMIIVYVLGACYTPDEYDVLAKEHKERLDCLIDGFVSACYDNEKNVYILSEVCEYICIQK